MKQTIRRGQTLVLLCMTALVIAMMVLMTLSLGAKVRDRMDLQTVADASAYSNAIATARTMNTMALMNRAMIAHTVSTIGSLSLISYATAYWEDTKAALSLFTLQLIIVGIGAIVWCIAAAICCASVVCASCGLFTARCNACIQSVILVGLSVLLMTMHEASVHNQLNNDITVWNTDTHPRWDAEVAMFTTASTTYVPNLQKQMENDAFTFSKSYLTQAKLSNNAYSFSAPATGLNDNELGRAFGQGPPSAPTISPNIDHSGPQPYHVAQMTMASRGKDGNKFVVERHPDVWDWSVDLTLHAIPNGVYAEGNSTGRGYVNTNIAMNPSSAPGYGRPGPPGGSGLWAHDTANRVHTLMILNFIAVIITANSSDYYTCTIFGPIAIIVGLIGKNSGMSQVGATAHSGFGAHTHSFPTQTFPSFYDFNPESLFNPDDLYGQPRNVALVRQNIPPRGTDPWNLTTGINGSGTLNARIDLLNEPGTHTDQRLIALGSGMTYYNRPDHYSEPPNLFAPYWHATLGRLAMDRPPAGSPARATYDTEVTQMLTNTGQTEAPVLYRSLTAAGYMGLEPLH